MAKIKFNPQSVEIEVETNTKILSAAMRAKVPIRYGCAACKCGTCGVQVEVNGELSTMASDEKTLLGRMNLATDGTIRLACRARIIKGEVLVDLDFQETYSPDQGE